MKACLTSLLLSTAISLIAIGVHTSNLILACMGGALAGIYNAIMNDRD